MCRKHRPEMSSTELRIEKLNSRQLKLLEKCREEWRLNGLGKGQTDRVKAEAAIKAAYRAVGLAEPRVIVWLKSPWAGNTASRILESDIDWPYHLNTAQLEVWDAVWKQCPRQLEAISGEAHWKEVRRSLRLSAEKKVIEREGVLLEKYLKDQFAENMGIYIWHYLRSLAGANVSKKLREEAENQVKSAIEGRLSALAAEQIYHELVQPVHLQVWSYVAEPLKQRIPTMSGILAGPQKWQINYGLHDSSWLSYYDFVDRLGIEGTTPLKGLTDLARNAGWVWAYENLCIMTDRPLEVHRDNRFRIHAEDKMCMRFGDDWGLYAWHGVLVPPYVILLPEPLTFDLIESEPNAEVRRVLIERFGLENYLREGKVVKMHQDNAGILYRMNLESDEPIIVVRVKNSTPEPDGSIKEYFLRVPPTMQRAKQAVAWTFGLTEEEYDPLVET